MWRLQPSKLLTVRTRSSLAVFASRYLGHQGPGGWLLETGGGELTIQARTHFRRSVPFANVAAIVDDVAIRFEK